MLTKRTFLFAFVTALMLALFLLDVGCGSTNVDTAAGISDIIHGRDTLNSSILLQLRLPKAITAMASGAALSVAGLLMQTTFCNPLAGPYVLGVSSGASLGVAIATLLGSALGLTSTILGNYSIALSAVLGAITVMLAILSITRKIRSTTTLLIIGVLFGSIASALISLLQSISDPDSLKLFINWTLGSLGTTTADQLNLLVPIVCLCLFACCFMLKPLDGILMGEEYASTIGIPVKRTRVASIIITSLLAGTTTAFTGPIGFVGIAIPHMTRALFRSSRHLVTIPGCAVCGALALLACDLLCHLPNNGYILPVNAICSIMGAPVVAYIILKVGKH